MVTKIVADYIESENLFSKGDKLIIALSGGADSVALLKLLIDMGYYCEAAHCNFHLRGDESLRDEAFVTHLCQKFDIKLHTIHFDTTDYAKKHKISIEMAARQLRYNWFESLRKDQPSTYIAVGHHIDDSVETVLLNIIRGTGINGLKGISPKNESIVRPLLCINRTQIINYLTRIDQDYIIDSTNLQDEYTRNKIRLNIIPLMESINPSVKQNIMKMSSHINEVDKIYQHQIEVAKERVFKNNKINIKALKKELSPDNVLFEILYPLGFNSSQIADIMHCLNGNSGKIFSGNGQYKIIKDREFLIVEEKTESDQPNFTLEYREVENINYALPRSKDIGCFDADKLKSTFNLRKWQQGDKFIPLGMKGKKLVSDFMTDIKLNRFEKENQWILTNGDDIIWVVGRRTDNRYKIDESTSKILEISLINHQ